MYKTYQYISGSSPYLFGPSVPFAKSRYRPKIILTNGINETNTIHPVLSKSCARFMELKYDRTISGRANKNLRQQLYLQPHQELLR